MRMDDDYDYWVEGPGAKPVEAAPALTVETIEGVEPLDTQFGVTTPLSVPAALQDALFGQPDPTEAEVAAHGGDTAQVPPLQTYAILDAAKVMNLPEMLETSDLPHRCLFKGEAYDELKNVAPWIVQIKDGDRFTRNLFTRSDAPWHMWDAEPGIYIRSRGTLDEMWKHFRKFTRIQDETGKWFYFRFWEPSAFSAVLTADACPFSAPLDVPLVSVIAVSRSLAKVLVVPLQEEQKESRPKAKSPTLQSQDRLAFDRSIEARFARDFAGTLTVGAQGHMTRLGLNDITPVAKLVSDLMDDLRTIGFQRQSDIGRVAAIGFYYGRWFLWDPRISPVARSVLGDKTRAPALRVLRFEQALSERPRHGLVTTSGGINRLIIDLRALRKHRPMWPDPRWDLGDADICAQFMTACAEQQDRYGMPREDQADHRILHTNLARLYTPFFLGDPLHANWRPVFDDISPDVVVRAISVLEGRLQGAERVMGHG